MKTTPIAEYLARKTVDAPRAAPVAAAPRRAAAAVNDDQEPEFRRSGLGAALARRAPDRPPLVRPIQGELPRREAPAPPPRPVSHHHETLEDIERKLSEAYHRGVQEGIDSASAEAATARALERAELQKRAVIEKLDFQMNEFARLGQVLSEGFNELERRVAQAAAQILEPLLERELSHRIVEELGENVARLARGGGVPLLTARGPEKLLSLLKERVEGLAIEIEYTEDESVEITVASPMTEIRSELGPWKNLIHDIVENG